VFAQQTALFRDSHTSRILIALPPSVPGGGAHSLAIEGVGLRGRVPPYSDEETYTVVLFIYMYFVLIQKLNMFTRQAH
jgi:hypothetical protein